MFSMILKLFLIFFTNLCLIIDSSNELLNEKCYFINKESNEKWKLVWQDNFQSENYFKQNWAIDHGTCDGEWHSQISCNVKDNVKLQDGFLVMSAKEEQYGQMNYTGARLTTDGAFGYGRYEARAALSVDDDVWSYFYTHIGTLDTDGFFIMHEFDDLKKSWHGAVYSEYDRMYKANDFDIQYGAFHLYGMEWYQNEVKFFIDDHYSEAILLDNADRMVKLGQHIRLWQGVRQFHKELPDKFNWKCPLWIVDYVEVEGGAV